MGFLFAAPVLAAWVVGVLYLGETLTLVICLALVGAVMAAGHLLGWSDEDDEAEELQADDERSSVKALAAGASALICLVVFDDRAAEAASLPLLVLFGAVFTWICGKFRARIVRQAA